MFMKNRVLYKRKNLKIPIYDTKLSFIVSDSVSKVSSETYYTFNDDELYAHALDNYTIIKGDKINNLYLILNPNHSFAEINIPILTHELTHIKNMVFRHKGYRIDTSNDECEAYLMGWLMKKSYKFFKEYLVN